MNQQDKINFTSQSNYISKINYLLILTIVTIYISSSNSLCNGHFLNINVPEFTYTRNGNNWKLYNKNDSSDEWLVSMLYTNKINETGFSFLEIETNSSLKDENQAYLAGYAEGLATHEIIYSQWYNLIKNYCSDTKTNCSAVNKFIKQNTEWIKSNILNHSTDSYWHQIKLYFYQMEGILDGYNKNAENHLQWIDIMWLNIFGDILDLRDALHGESSVGMYLHKQ